MKKIFNILCVAAAIVALASCAKDNFIKRVGPAKTFSAGFDITKTAVDSTYKTTWTNGDKLLILNSAGDQDLINIPDASAGSSTTAITTTIPDDEVYYAVYGDNTAWVDGSDIDVCIDASQTGAWADAQKAVAIADNQTFNLKNISSVIEFEVSDAVTSVEFISEGKLANEVYVSFTDGVPALTTMDNADAIEVSTNKTAGTYYAACFPTELDSLGINISYEGGVIKHITIDVPLSLTAGKALVLGDIESRAGKTYKVVSKETFSATTGDIDSEGAFSYKANKGGASTNPAINNGCIRIYQGTPGGNIEITSNNGDKIKGIKVTNGKNYNSLITVVEDDAAFNAADTVFVGKNKTRSFSCLNANKVTIYNYSPGGASSYRFELYSISVTYEVDPRTPQTLSFPQASYSVKTGETFEAPTVSGAMTTVTYSTSDPDVATVNASTGAVSIVAAGTCTISATAEGTETYKEGVASYELTVAAGATGIAGIKTIIRSVEAGTETSFVADVEDMLITYCQKSAYPYIAYAQDKDGDAIYFWGSSADDLPFVTGDKFTGSISGKGKVKNGLTQITEIDIDGANKTSGCTVTPQVVTLQELMASYSTYEYKIIKVEAATIESVFNASTTGKITQNSTSANIRGGSSTTISVTEGSVADIIAFPAYYNTDTQLVVWKQEQITPVGGPNVITATTAKTIAVGEEWTIGATCMVGTVSYEITEGGEYVSLTSGVVTGVAKGTAKIKVTSPAESGFTGQEATITVTVNDAGATELEFDFSKNITGWPTASKAGNYTYTLNKVDYTFILSADAYCNTTYYFAKKKSTTGLPAIAGKKLTKIVVKNSSGCSKSASVSVTDGTNVVTGGAGITWGTTSSTYTYTLSNTTENTVYYLTVSNAANAQIIKLILTYEDVK